MGQGPGRAEARYHVVRGRVLVWWHVLMSSALVLRSGGAGCCIMPDGLLMAEPVRLP